MDIRPKIVVDNPRIYTVEADISDVNLTIPQFDRIISMCVFHHLSDPINAILNIKRFLKPNGVFSLFYLATLGYSIESIGN